jgi:hypothetical protein
MKPSTNFGDIAFGSAKVEGSNATYEPADDCKLTFESKDK